MRRTLPRSSRTSFPALKSPTTRRLNRRSGFRPALSQLEQRTLLASVTWINPAGGDWDTPANWSTGALPGPSDDVVIEISGITVTHSSTDSDSVNSLTISASDSTLNLSNGSLAIASDSSISGDLTISGGTLSTAGALTVSGTTDWTAGTITAGGTLAIAAGASLALGTPGCCGGNEVLDGGTLDNQGTATLDTYAQVGGLVLQDGAVFDNQSTGSFTIQTNAAIYSDGTGTFQNEGTLTQAAGAVGTTAIEAAFNQTSTGSTLVDGGTLELGGRGAITGPVTAAAGTTLSLAGEALSSSSVIASDGTVQLQNCTEAGSYSATAGTYADDVTFTGAVLALGNLEVNGTVNFAPAVGGPVTLTTGTLNVDGGATLTGTDSFVVNGLFTLVDFATINTPGTIDAYGGVTVISATLSGVTLNNHAGSTATWRVNDGNGVGISLNSGATINNLANATFDVVDFYGGAGLGGDGTGVFNNFGMLTSTAQAGIDVPFNNSGSVVITQGSLGLGVNTASPSSASSGSFTAAAGTTLSLAGEALSSSSVIASDGTVQLQNCTEAGSYSATAGTYADDVTFTGAVLALGNLEVNGTVNFAPAVGGPVTLTTGTLNVDGGATLTGTDSFVVNGLFTLVDFATINTPGTIDAYGGVTVISATLSGVTLNNHAGSTATWRVNDGNGVGISLNSGATINNLANATFDVVDFYGGAGLGGDGTGVFNNFGMLTSTAQASIDVLFNNFGSVTVRQGSLGLSNATTSGTVTVASGTSLGANSYTQTAGDTVLNGGTLNGGTYSIDAGALTGIGIINANVTNAGQVFPGGTGAAGLLTINGNYTQTAAGSLDIDIGGTSAGSQYDAARRLRSGHARRHAQHCHDQRIPAALWQHIPGPDVRLVIGQFRDLQRPEPGERSVSRPRLQCQQPRARHRQSRDQLAPRPFPWTGSRST